MNFKIIGSLVICAVVIIFLMMRGEQKSESQEVSNAEATEVQVASEEFDSDSPLEQVVLDEKPSEDLDSEKETPLDKLFKKVNKLSMFDQRRLDELRLEAYQWMDENPKEFETFTLNKISEAEKHSIESMFFFVEAYAKKHPNAVEGVNEILNMQSDDNSISKEGHARVDGTQKQNMTKAFAMEVYFDRLEKGGSVDQDSIGKLEESIRSMVEKESDLMLVRQSALVLRNYLDYDSGQLKELVESRSNSGREGHALSDVYKD